MRAAVTLLICLKISMLSAEGEEDMFKAFINSLKRELAHAKTTKQKAEQLMHLSENYRYYNPDSSIYFARQSLELAQTDDLLYIKVGAMGFMAQAIASKGDLPTALGIGLEAIEIGKDLPELMLGGYGPAYSLVGDIYLQIGMPEKAKLYYRVMSRFSDDDLIGNAFGHLFMANAFYDTNQLDSALWSLAQSKESFDRLNYSLYPAVYNRSPMWYIRRANVYMKKNKNDSALYDLKTALQMTTRANDASQLSFTLNELAKFYKAIGNKDSIIYYAERAFSVAGKIAFVQAQLTSSALLAQEYEDIDAKKALFYLKLNSEKQHELYGAGNIQVLRDMIDSEEKRIAQINAAKIEFQNDLKIYFSISVAIFLAFIAIVLFRGNKKREQVNKLLNKSLEDLKSTQSQLIHSEKMASLGELTAGIAHEIQNPLNFVNNFSEVSTELVSELNAEIDKGNTKDAKEIATDLKQNLEKINHHGKRADGIVKSMLQHSRSSSGQKEPTDINALCDEYLRLSYHGYRAKDNTFNANFETDFDSSLPKINVVPQDIGRVILNLINNAFYAVNEKLKKENGNYEPLITVTTKNFGDKIEISIKDNGNGIPDSIKEKIFQPFFTTKPTGQGTGLGLSLSYDIVKAHGGELKVESKESGESEFIILLPGGYERC